MPVKKNTDHAKLVSQIKKLERRLKGRELEQALKKLRPQARQFNNAGISFGDADLYASTKRLLRVH